MSYSSCGKMELTRELSVERPGRASAELRRERRRRQRYENAVSLFQGQLRMPLAGEEESIFGVEDSRHYTATVTVVSVRVTGRYMVSRSKGMRPASVIRRIRS